MTEGVLGRQGMARSPSISYVSTIPCRRPLLFRHRKAFTVRARLLDLARASGRLIGEMVSRLRDRAYPLSQAGWRFIYGFFAAGSFAALSIKRFALAFAHGCKHIFLSLKARSLLRLRARLTVALASAAVVLFLIGTFFYSLGLEVMLDGKSIGFVSSQSEFESAVANVSERASEILGRPYLITPNVTYRYSMVDRQQIFNQNDVETQLFSQIEDVAYLYVLSVDGRPAGASTDMHSLQSVLDNIIAPALWDGVSYDVGFVNDVQITHEWTDKRLITDAPSLRETLTAPVRDTEIYELLPEDDFSLIALSNGMTTDDLQNLNPELSGAEPEAGVSLVVAPAIPLLSVESFQDDVYTREVPFESITVSDSDLYIGESELRTVGVAGEERVTDKIRFVNGIEDTRHTLSVEVLTEPVTEVTAVGTRKRPPKSPTGSFIYPCDGTLTSNYGYRRLFGGEFHPGIDLAAPTGTSIVAADGGTVIHSGWKSGYGYCVMISHGKGLVSLYGHCSKLLVSDGQAVAKGERIARVGSTGRSTGPHCHFEMRLNGQTVSPWKYLN